jgi:tRNA threonylcarbamoyladenosine biosynthesis protein TsaB
VIIAIDGASTDLSLAVAEPDGTLLGEDAWSSLQRQSAELLPHLLALLERVGRPLGETTAVAVGTGPGSFTGLRVAMALAKGIAAGLGIPIVGGHSLNAWLDADSAAVAAVSRAGAREAYLLARGRAETHIVDRDDLPHTAPVVAAGELANAFGLTDARRPRGAIAIAALAAARLATDPAGDDPRTLEPIYLRAPRGVPAESGERVKWL